MIRVVIESPLKGKVPAWCPRWLAPFVERYVRRQNRRYALACMRDSLARTPREAPYASHLLFDQPGLLDDADDAQRELGIAAGFAWGRACELRVFYLDRGMSSGMQRGLDEAIALGQPYERRWLKGGAR